MGRPAGKAPGLKIVLHSARSMDASLGLPVSGQREPAHSTAQSTSGRIALIYILSASHSGSTLLAMQLARHPGVCTVGELSETPARARPGYRCSCGAELAHCGFWKQVGAAMAKRGYASYSPTGTETSILSAPSRYARRLLRPLHRGRLFELARDAALLLSAPARSHIRENQRLKAALAESVLECSGDTALIDTSKVGVQLKYHLRNPRFDVKAIWLVRDGRGVASSLMRNERVAMRQAANEWRRSYAEAAAVLGRMDPSRWTRVRYEDLCTDPEGTLRALWRFMDVAPRLAESRAPADFHVLGHNASRLNGEQKIRLNEKWRSELSAADLRSFEAVAGALNRELGYR